MWVDWEDKPYQFIGCLVVIMFVYVVYTFLSNFPAESDVTRDERSISEGSNHMQESLRSANSSTRSSVLMESKEEVFMFNTANPDL